MCGLSRTSSKFLFTVISLVLRDKPHCKKKSSKDLLSKLMLWLWKEPCVIQPLRRNLQHTVISKLNKQPIRPLEIVPETRYETSWAVFWSLNHTCFQTKTAPKPYPLGRHIPICVIWGSTALPLPRDCFHCGTRGDELFSLFHCTIWEAFRKIDTNELHDI